MGRRKKKNGRLTNAQKMRLVQAEAKAARRKFSKRLVAATIAGAVIGGYAKERYHNSRIESKKKEVLSLNKEYERSLKMKVLEVVRKEMDKNKIGMQEAVQKVAGVDITNPIVKKHLARIHQKDFSDPQTVALALKVGLQMLKKTGVLKDIMNDQSGSAKKIQAVALDIQREGTSKINFAMGAGLGTSAILVLAISYVMAKKMKALKSKY